ncbi:MULTISPECIES: hypothetical protein [Vibrio]|nr:MULTISPECIES: hypothetical protein [Vibrio]
MNVDDYAYAKLKEAADLQNTINPIYYSHKECETSVTQVAFFVE